MLEDLFSIKAGSNIVVPDDYMRTLLRRPGTTASDPDDWDDHGRLYRTEFYPDDRERSETII